MVQRLVAFSFPKVSGLKIHFFVKVLFELNLLHTLCYMQVYWGGTKDISSTSAYNPDWSIVSVWHKSTSPQLLLQPQPPRCFAPANTDPPISKPTLIYQMFSSNMS